MQEWIWQVDVYIYAYLKVWTGKENQVFSRMAGEFFLYFPLFAFLFVSLVIQKEKPWFREILFFISSGILSFQISAFLALLLNRPSPLALEQKIAGIENVLPIKDAFAFPDWAMASTLALLVFYGVRMGSHTLGVKIMFLIFLLAFAFFRVNGAFSFFSDVMAGLVIGSLVGFIFAKLLSRVEKLPVS